MTRNPNPPPAGATEFTSYAVRNEEVREKVIAAIRNAPIPVTVSIRRWRPNAPAPIHRCHWPGCDVEVPPQLWGCKPHWMSLPAPIRAAILKSYRRGQEIRKDPSPEYLAAAQDWIAAYRVSSGARS